MQLVGIQIYNLDIARIKNQRNETDICVAVVVVPCLLGNFHWKLSALTPVHVEVQVWRLSDY